MARQRNPGAWRRLALLASLVLPAAMAVPARAAIAPEAAPLIERHLEWLGGRPALAALEDLTLEGTIEVAGLSGPLSIRMRRDGRQLMSVDLRVFRTTEALDGDDAWERNASGQVEPMGAAKAASARRGLDRAFSRHLDGQDVEVTRLADEQKEGRAWAVLRFAYDGGDLYDLLLDEGTGASEWSRDVRDGRTQWTRTLDVREEGGLRLAHRQETLDENPLQNQVVTWTTVAANRGLPDDLFRRPGAQAAPSLARLAGDAAATDWIPVELYMDRWIFVEGLVNGTPTSIVLDSGAGITVLDRATSDRLGLVATGAVPAQGVGGTTTAGIVEGITLEIGGLRLGPVTAATLDLADIGRRLGRPMPVILGKEVFQALVVDVDYPNARLRFLDPDRFAGDGTGHRLEVIPGGDGHRHVKMAIEGLPEAVFALDTGQGGALTVFRRYADEHGLLEGRPTSRTKGGGVGGMIEMSTATLRSVTLAGFELRDVPTAFHRDDVGGAFDTAKLAGNLGAGILNRFRVTFDYAHDCLWLEPGRDFAEPMARDRLGLDVWRDGDTLVVEFVAPGSPAATAGWQAGERISALDGAPVSADWWRRWAEWSRAPDGAPAHFTMADGSVRSLRTAAYY
ncbi:MAG: aspartyl protease family protein [bacterium]|nr:aspartyl protease family protein [bacterium]